MFNKIQTEWESENVCLEKIIARHFLKEFLDNENGDLDTLKGIYHHKGLFGFPVDHKEAVKSYEKAMTQKNKYAICNLALMYENGDGVDRNVPKAIELYEESVKLECTSAMNDLGSIYEHGHGVDKNISRAIELYTKASDLGCATAMYNMAVLYLAGKGVEKNLLTAGQWCLRAINSGDTDAKNLLERICQKFDKTR